MNKDFRKWFLLRRIWRKSLTTAEDTSDHAMLVNSLSWLEKSRFLKDIAEHRFFFFRRSEKTRNERILKDNSILDECLAENPPLIAQSTAHNLQLDSIIPELGGQRQNDAFIRITGHGNRFADTTNFFFVYLPERYKALWAVVFALVGYAWAPIVLTYLLPFISKHLFS